MPNQKNVDADFEVLIFQFIFLSFKYVKMFVDASVPLILMFLGFSTSFSLWLKNVDGDLEVRQLG